MAKIIPAHIAAAGQKATNEPKRHHYIPRMLLRNFTNEKGLLYFFDKRFPDKNVLESAPSNLFLETHLYTQYNKSGGKDVWVEKFFAEIERDGNAVVKKIINAAKEGKSPKLTAPERKIWDRFFCCQMIRVPDILNAEIDDNFDKLLSEIWDEYEKRVRPFTAEERAERDNPDVRIRIKHNLRAVTPANVLLREGKVMAALGSKGLAVGIIRNPKKSFIIGSNPCVKTSGWKNLFS